MIADRFSLDEVLAVVLHNDSKGWKRDTMIPRGGSVTQMIPRGGSVTQMIPRGGSVTQ